MKSRWIVIVALLGAASMMACGSDDEGEASGAAVKASCNEYCDAAVAKGCQDSADCKTFECEEVDQATGPCATEMKRYYDCMKAQTDVCAQTCSLDLAKCT